MQFKLMHSATLCILLIACICNIAMCRPSEPGTHQPEQKTADASEYYGHLSSDTIRKLQKCDMDMDVMELCMRCAKVTRSHIVYPLCCDNEDNVQGWCHKYIYYGKRT